MNEYFFPERKYRFAYQNQSFYLICLIIVCDTVIKPTSRDKQTSRVLYTNIRRGHLLKRKRFSMNTMICHFGIHLFKYMLCLADDLKARNEIAPFDYLALFEILFAWLFSISTNTMFSSAN